MINQVKQYAWGSPDLLAKIQGRSPGGRPEAELWMGSHPNGASQIVTPRGETVSLASFLAESPALLGPRSLELQAPGEDMPGLPFLLKVLTAGKGLSIQAHPDREQAREGFAREEAQGVPRDAPLRTYRDQNHKPELICALTEFWGLCGFRPLEELRREFLVLSSSLARLNHPLLDEALEPFLEDPREETWEKLFLALLECGLDRSFRDDLVRTLSSCLEGRNETRDRYWWVRELLGQYPGDPGAFAPLYLNLFHLQPGEAVFLGSRVLHAYLRGAGVEIMANSDNVLRSGCTEKHVDCRELARILSFESFLPHPSSGCNQQGLRVYVTPAREFELVRVPREGRIEKREGPAILLATEGPVVCDGLLLESGESVFLDHAAEKWDVSGPGVASAYIAALPGTLSFTPATVRVGAEGSVSGVSGDERS
ncbi:mannose-6-phosphate isomerase, type 1 [Alkalispirochaeta americana]|uniref:mannose-6-phosphate isomerase n=2 Tax=Alkalispirochaeta americana TaxID=159291 RepID=A0A1N6QYL0_9SPIO|nr:mannose-6-phosphate isomerase, type 1 [Alkalispirochaeta americana]